VPTITALEPQRKNKERINVSLDGKFAFGLAAILAARLKVGQQLSLAEIESLQAEDQVEKAHARVLKFLSYRPRSRAELEKYLADKRVPVATQHQVLERLSRVGLVDDAAFVRFWVENREAFRPRSRHMLGYELRRKGIDPTLIESAVEEVDEAESAYRALSARAARYARLDRVTFRRRAGGFLRRRGFSYEVIEDVLRRVWEEQHA